MRGFPTNSNPSTPAGVGGASPGSNLQQSPASPVEEPNRPAVEALTPPGFPKPPAREPAPLLDLDASVSETAIESNVQISIPSPIFQAGSYGGDTGYRSGSMSSGSAKKRKLNDGDEFADLGEGDLDADVAEMLRQDSGTV
jgi:regulator of Ty1 transposition protein 103